MILPFITKWPAHMGQLAGKPTGFVEKIWKGLKELSMDEYYSITQNVPFEEMTKQYPVDSDIYESCTKKIHTMREDNHDRWLAGKNIHFFINNRSKNAFQFAPVIPCVGTQDVYMTLIQGRFEITVDDNYLYYPDKLTLAKNDGFDTVEDFQHFFFPPESKEWSIYKKLIHWTNFRY